MRADLEPGRDRRWAIADELHRMVLNLLENAIRHTPEGTSVGLGLDGNGERACSRSPTTAPGCPRAPRRSSSAASCAAAAPPTARAARRRHRPRAGDRQGRRGRPRRRRQRRPQRRRRRPLRRLLPLAPAPAERSDGPPADRHVPEAPLPRLSKEFVLLSSRLCPGRLSAQDETHTRRAYLPECGRGGK